MTRSATPVAAATDFTAVADWLKLPEGRQNLGNMHGDIAVSSAGEVYVSVQDPAAGLQVYAPDGKFLRNVPNAPSDFHGFVIRKQGRQFTIHAVDAAGARYGSLAFAEQLSIKKDLNKITPETVNPTFRVRTIKFNLPWEPYRESRSMEYHLSACRDLKFWESYLDMMFENRFNVLALYNMHPFP